MTAGARDRRSESRCGAQQGRGQAVSLGKGGQIQKDATLRLASGLGGLCRRSTDKGCGALAIDGGDDELQLRAPAVQLQRDRIARFEIEKGLKLQLQLPGGAV